MDGRTEARTAQAPWAGIALSLMSTPAVMAAIALAPILPSMLQVYRAVPDAELLVPLLLSVPGICAALGSIPLGRLGEIWGKKNLLIISLILFAVAGAAPFWQSDFAFVFATRLIVGLGQAAALVLGASLLSETYEGTARDRWLAGQTFVAAISAIILFPSAGFLAQSLGWQGPFLLYLFGLPLALLVAIFCREGEGVRERQADAAWSAIPWNWLCRFCLVSVLLTVIFYALQLHIGLALSLIGVSDLSRIGLLSAIAMIGIPIGSILFMRIGPVSLRLLIPAEIIFCGATLIGLSLSGNVGLFVFTAFLHMVACGLLVPTMVTSLVRRLKVEVRARGIGIWQAAFATGQFLSVIIVASIAKVLGVSSLAALGWLGALAIILIPVVVMMIGPEQEAAA